MRVILHPAADKEIEQAADYLEEKREGFGLLFLDAIEETLAHLKSYPISMQRKVGELREVTIPRFQYVLVYEHINDTIHIYHVVHGRRHPARRRKRK